MEMMSGQTLYGNGWGVRLPLTNFELRTCFKAPPVHAYLWIDLKGLLAGTYT